MKKPEREINEIVLLFTTNSLSKTDHSPSKTVNAASAMAENKTT